MECRPLEITIASAKDLKDVNLFSKMDVYAVASIKGDPFGATQKQKTHVHKDSGQNPTWNFPMKFTLHEDSLEKNRLVLKIEIISDRSFGDKEIGEVHVPIKELLDSQSDKSQFKETAYGVKTPSGKSKGTLCFTFKFGEKFNAPAKEKAQSSNFPVHDKAKKHEEPVMAYPAGYAPGASSVAYPPPHYGAYNQPPPPYQQPYAAPPPPGYAYSGYPQQPGYGYGGYPPVQQPQKPKKNGSGMALGLGAGLLGGLLVGDMISDVGDMAAYDAGYDAGFDDGFDF